MPAAESILYILGMASVIAIVSLAVTLSFKMERVQLLSAEIQRLRQSLQEMDEQAKLIVRTDMELNKIQEELDKKVTGLFALQRLSRTISTTLEENQVFQRISPSLLEELGFERTACFLWNEHEQLFQPRLAINYSTEELEALRLFVNSRRDDFRACFQKEKPLSSFSAEAPEWQARVKETFGVHSFIIAPLLPKEGDKGFFFAGTENADSTITEGDEELIAVLTNQIGQALENARLFEKTWKAHQDLERKVEERTHALTLALEEVKRISKRKNDFISAVSHELRTPLTSIKGYASILLAGKLGDIPEEVRLRLDKINRHSDELTRLVNDLLDISRIESGRVEMKQVPLNLADLMTQVYDLLGGQLKDKELRFSSSFPADAARIFADAGQINRVFINIIGNAIKFTPAHGSISVTSSRRDEKTAEIAISDTGCGIPKESLETIFEEFYRVDNQINETVKGTGLGLSLVKQIVEAHGGTIWATSVPDKGTTFHFTVPLAP